MISIGTIGQATNNVEAKLKFADFFINKNNYQNRDFKIKMIGRL